MAITTKKTIKAWALINKNGNICPVTKREMVSGPRGLRYISISRRNVACLTGVKTDSVVPITITYQPNLPKKKV